LLLEAVRKSLARVYRTRKSSGVGRWLQGFDFLTRRGGMTMGRKAHIYWHRGSRCPASCVRAGLRVRDLLRRRKACPTSTGAIPQGRLRNKSSAEDWDWAEGHPGGRCGGLARGIQPLENGCHDPRRRGVLRRRSLRAKARREERARKETVKGGSPPSSSISTRPKAVFKSGGTHLVGTDPVSNGHIPPAARFGPLLSRRVFFVRASQPSNYRGRVFRRWLATVI